MDTTSWWPSSDGAPPRWATRRDRTRPSDGEQIAAVATALGTPLTPWQRHVVDVATERRPDGSFEYQVVVVSVPRQTGKTALIRAIATHAAMIGRSVFYTAQTGKDARARWLDLIKALRVSPAFKAKMKSGAIKIALRGGSEHATFPGGGLVQAFAPTEDAMHGSTPSRVFIDEAFAQTQERGELLIGAIEPAQRTVLDKQIWLVSTRGTAESTWFHDWIDRARNGIDRVALFDWGASEDHDPFDVDDIAEFHPAVGFEFTEIGAAEGVVTTARDILAAADRMSRAEYVRAYANRVTMTTANLISPEAWRGLVDDVALEPPTADALRDATLVYDVDEHQASAAVVLVWDDPATGKPAVKVVRSDTGAAWLVDEVERLDLDWRPARVVAVGNGPALDLTQQLRDRGVDVDELGEREFAAASTAMLAAINDRDLVHDNGDALAGAMTGLVTRTAVVDGVAFSRRHSVGQSAPAIAATAGLYRHRHAHRSAPLVRFR